MLVGASLATHCNQRRWGMLFVLAASLGLLSILGTGFAIGHQGWIWLGLQSGRFGLPVGQAAMGWGGMCVSISLLMLLAVGCTRLGAFRGDIFTACAVFACSGLLLMFVGLPVFRALAEAFLDDGGTLSIGAAAARIFSTRIWSLSCMASGGCGVAWNTLFLAIASATGTTVLGTLLAMLTERSGSASHRYTKPVVNLLATLPLITPPFVVGMGLILLFGRAGLVNELLESLFGLEPTRWLYGAQGTVIERSTHINLGYEDVYQQSWRSDAVPCSIGRLGAGVYTI